MKNKAGPSAHMSTRLRRQVETDFSAAMVELVTRCLALLPLWLQRFVIWLFFWPEVIINRILWRILGDNWRPPKSEVVDGLWLGSAPVFRDEIEELVHQHRLRGVVNLCQEWRGNVHLYQELGVDELYLPTIDHHPPQLRDCEAGAQFIHEILSRGDSVLVHCKAGKSRSVVIVLCYLVKYQKLSPQEAHMLIASRRPRISRRFHLPEVQSMVQHRTESDVSETQGLAEGSKPFKLRRPGKGESETDVLIK